MGWYAAHIVLAVEFLEGEQDHFPAWENIVLFRAETEAVAWRLAEERGLREAGEEGEFRWAGRRARWRFAGVRKLTECVPAGDRPDDGDEVSYIELEFRTRSDLDRFLDNQWTTMAADEHARDLMEEDESSKTGSGASSPA
jgi:hypothetical protein